MCKFATTFNIMSIFAMFCTALAVYLNRLEWAPILVGIAIYNEVRYTRCKLLEKKDTNNKVKVNRRKK